MVSSASFFNYAVVQAPPVVPTPKVEEQAKEISNIVDFKEKSYVVVKTSFEGFHKYPNAPEGVEFLRSEHRHIFYVEAKIEVYTNNRELEFILVKRFLNQLFTNGQQDHKSCEMIAHDITNAIVQRYGKRDVTVSVFEDNENGGVYERVYK